MLVGVFGVLIGLLGSFGATRLLSSQLYKVKATDPWTFGVVALLLSNEPQLTPAEVKQRLVATAEPSDALVSKTTASGRVCATDMPLRMAFQSVSSRNVTAASNFSASHGGAISNSNPAPESNAARLGELDASTSEGMAR